MAPPGEWPSWRLGFAVVRAGWSGARPRRGGSPSARTARPTATRTPLAGESNRAAMHRLLGLLSGSHGPTEVRVADSDSDPAAPGRLHLSRVNRSPAIWPRRVSQDGRAARVVRRRRVGRLEACRAPRVRVVVGRSGGVVGRSLRRLDAVHGACRCASSKCRRDLTTGRGRNRRTTRNGALGAPPLTLEGSPTTLRSGYSRDRRESRQPAHAARMLPKLAWAWRGSGGGHARSRRFCATRWRAVYRA